MQSSTGREYAKDDYKVWASETNSTYFPITAIARLLERMRDDRVSKN